MKSYNVKLITYPDLTRQFRIYSRLKGGGYRSSDKDHIKESNPFDGMPVKREITCDINDYFQLSLDRSLRRIKGKVHDYARSNEWQWFVTFTFDSDKVDRYDYDLCADKLKSWIDYVRRSSPGLMYLIVPEQHKDGAYHFHGLMNGLDVSQIVWTGKYVIKRVRSDGHKSRFVKTDHKIYKFGSYNLGFMTATKVQENDRVTSYITKYLTKDMMSGLSGRKRYWASRNLDLPVEETWLLDATDRFLLSSELSEEAAYSRVSMVTIDGVTQSMELYEIK